MLSKFLKLILIKRRPSIKNLLNDENNPTN